MSDEASSDARIQSLISAAHQCDTLDQIDDSLPFRNFGAMWDHLASERGDQSWMQYYPCNEDEETPERHTFGAFADLIRRVAGLLSERYGIGPASSVATLTINHPLTVATYFAAWRLGARVVPVNPGETDDRAEYIVKNSEAKLFVAHHTCRGDYGLLDGLIDSSVQRAMICDSSEPPSGWDDFNAALAAARPGPEDAPGVSWDSEALVVYTSGTTGNPKGVVLSQKQMFADAFAICQWHDITADSVMMNVLPIHHVNGIVVTLVSPAFAGAEVIVNRRFRCVGFWNKLAAHGVHIVSVVPTLLQFLLESNEPFDKASVPVFRYFICGAGPLSVELAREFQEKFGLRILHGYGLSETVCYWCFLPTDLETEVHNAWMYDHGFPSIGAAVVVNEMAIHDPEGRPVPDGEKGEIVIRGHNIMCGYFRNPEANAGAFTFGWFRSGDEGFRLPGKDERHYYFITGRLKELIIRGGVNISPFEIDEILTSMPGVRVGLAVGFENRYYGEEVGAYVQIESGQGIDAEAVLAYCRDQLPSSKCPKVVLFGDDIPVTSTGKYQRGRLKHLFEAYKDRQFRG